MVRNSRPVLLVEDDVIDAMTIRRAFRDLNMTNPLVHVTDGEEAFERLRDERSDKPCLILLDLNMPKMNGIEFLAVAKADRALKRIPVIVLTTSGEERDVVESFRLSVAGYIVKPFDYEAAVKTLKIVDEYWNINHLPAFHT